MSELSKGNKSNVLSIENLRKVHQNEFTESEGIVDFNGNKENFFFYNKFPESKINEFIKDFLEFNFGSLQSELKDGETESEYVERIKQDLNDVARMAPTYMSLLIVDKFTSLSDTIPESIEDRIVYIDMLLDFDLLNEIVSQLPEDEIERASRKLHESMTQKTNQALENMEENEKNIAKIEDVNARRAIQKELETTKKAYKEATK